MSNFRNFPFLLIGLKPRLCYEYTDCICTKQLFENFSLFRLTLAFNVHNCQHLYSRPKSYLGLSNQPLPSPNRRHSYVHRVRPVLINNNKMLHVQSIHELWLTEDVVQEIHLVGHWLEEAGSVAEPLGGEADPFAVRVSFPAGAGQGCRTAQTYHVILATTRPQQHQAVRVATEYAPAPLPTPLGAQAPRRRNVAVLSHAEYVPTLTAAAALCVKGAQSKAAWWPWPLTFWTQRRGTSRKVGRLKGTGVGHPVGGTGDPQRGPCAEPLVVGSGSETAEAERL